MVAAQARKQALSEQDVMAARAEVADGRAVTVWFTASAVGVPAGGSAKIVAVGEVAEGDFIQVRPTGSRDTMFCSAGELTRTRPPRRQPADARPAVVRARPAAERVAEPADRPRTEAKAATAATGTASAAVPARRAAPEPTPPPRPAPRPR
jgi:hypothetical protein